MDLGGGEDGSLEKSFEQEKKDAAREQEAKEKEEADLSAKYGVAGPRYGGMSGGSDGDDVSTDEPDYSEEGAEPSEPEDSDPGSGSLAGGRRPNLSGPKYGLRGPRYGGVSGGMTLHDSVDDVVEAVNDILMEFVGKIPDRPEVPKSWGGKPLFPKYLGDWHKGLDEPNSHTPMIPESWRSRSYSQPAWQSRAIREARRNRNGDHW
ncbi:hypothetical protein GGR56DRAFT_624171 [Xylariaceae sp. FL0804]|nr:hypothetical protein GGR56DRAFT_624171 [Xylariaceae sp. FL0804]